MHAGPNGGIVAAVLLRACVAEVNDVARSPRTLTVHYLGPPGEGTATVEVTEERAGRGMTFLSARLVQDTDVGPQARAVALVAFGAPRAERVAWSARPLPPMAPPEQCPDLAVDGEPEPPNIRHRWQCRWALGQAGSAGPTEGTLTGGWLRPAEPTGVDHVLVAAMADAWLPPIIARPGIPPLSVPTVELTVHFRDTTTLGQLSAKDWFACEFSHRRRPGGFLGRRRFDLVCRRASGGHEPAVGGGRGPKGVFAMSDASPPAEFDPLAVPISPAATVMVVEDRSGQGADPGGLAVLMLRRTARAVFAGDMWVYPGGRVDAGDEEIAARHVTGLNAAEADHRLGVDRGGLAYWVAALRECFEEAGILLARGLADGAAIDLAEPARQQRLARYRDALNAGQMTFGEVIAAEEVVLDAARIHYIAHWVTPLGSPRRFDTRFFLAAAPPGQVAAHDDTEVVHHEWVTPAAALQRWHADEMAMMSPTARMLMCLTPFERASEAVSAAALNLEPHQIRVRRDEDAYHIMLPGDPGWEDGDPETEFGWIKLRPPVS